MKDKRSFEIKRILRFRYSEAKFKVRIDKYSMGETIYINTDLIKRQRIDDPSGYGYIETFTEESKDRLREMNQLLKDYESVDRDESGDILSGGNTFLFIEAL